MARTRFLTPLRLAALTVCASIGSSVALADGGARKFKIEVTNLTAAQTFTPVLAASHKSNVKLFTPGMPSSVPLEELAEGGSTAALALMLAGTPGVRDVVTGGAVPPGATETLTVKAGGRFDHISIAAMLVPTNDAFVALNGVEGPKGGKTITLYAFAYDSGTEENDELCANIPGGGGCAGTGFDPDRTDAEGHVHVHRGIHGVGPDLSAATYDWRNPVARVVITAIGGRDHDDD